MRAALRDSRLQELVHGIDSAPNRPKVGNQEALAAGLADAPLTQRSVQALEQALLQPEFASFCNQVRELAQLSKPCPSAMLTDPGMWTGPGSSGN